MKHFRFLLMILILLGCINPKENKELKTKEIWGERHFISGDFDGDKRSDTLEEKFISSQTNKEINKYFGLDYDSMVSLTMAKYPISLLVSMNSHLDTLKITSPTGQIFGLNYLTNLGDNNNNKKDEIGLIVDWADWSNVNSFKIYELNDSLKWTRLQSFEIREFDDFDSIIQKDNGKLTIRMYNLGEKVDSIIKIE